MSPRSVLFATFAVGLTLTATATATAAPYSPRPHTDFELRDAGVAVARFDVRARPRGRRVLISVTMTARSRAKDVSAVLRVGRCTGGPVRTPRCEPQVSRRVVLHPGRTTILHLNARVQRPRGARGAMRVSLTPPGRVVRPSSPFVAIVDMLLPASAWTSFAGQRFGLRVARPWEGDRLAYDARTIDARGSQVDADRLRATLSWTARAIPAGTVVTTTTGECRAAGAACPPPGESVSNQIGRAGEGRRPLLPRAEPKQVLTYAARTAEGPLFDLVMPWPR
jgi:hypothetical protein